MSLAVSTVALGVLSVVPASAARPAVLAVWDGQDYEYQKYCTTDEPFQCNLIRSGHINITIQVSNRPRPNAPITVGYQIVDGTSTAGQDYQAATSGTVVIPANAAQAAVQVPLVNDGVAEATETFTVRLTSSSIPANISDTGVGTILDGSQIPPDCSLFRHDDRRTSLTCDNRPPTQNWRLNMFCLGPFGIQGVAMGNVVTGNGTSLADCNENDIFGYGANTAFAVVS